MKLLSRGFFWFGCYLLVILFPLIGGWLRHPAEVEGRPFWLLFSSACGYVALSTMAFEFVLISRVGMFASAFGQDVLLKFHRQMGVVAVVLIALHVIFVFRNGYPVAWLNPLADGTVQWGTLAAYCLALLIVLSVCRKSLKLSYGLWQFTHSFLASAIILLGAVHVLQLGSFVGPTAIKELWAIYLLLLIALFVRFRFWKPIRAWRKPWTITQNIEERGGSRTIVLKPAGHGGFTFEPGQFAWLNTGKTPFARDQHPISMSSCAYDDVDHEVAFTIRNLGDWSGGKVPALTPGTRMWLDGPYGVFTPDREQGPGYVLIGGGVGITPLYSMCLTFVERGDVRPVVLFYAGAAYEQMTLREQIDSLQTRMNLTVVYVLSNPSPDWKGERGFVSSEVLRRHLPNGFKRMQYFVCGPPPMMDAMEKILPELGVAAELIHTERFEMV
jgi:predicted ferric reductase